MARYLVEKGAAVDARDVDHESTSSGARWRIQTRSIGESGKAAFASGYWCLHGSVFGEKKDSGDFVGVARLLIEAGEVVEPRMLPTGRDDVDQVLRAHLARV